MQFDEFIGKVQQRARLSSRGEAERAISATLTTLADRLAGGTADNLAAQLPSEIGRHLQAGGRASSLEGGGTTGLRSEATEGARCDTGLQTHESPGTATAPPAPERLSADEFFARVARREGVDASTAAFHARAVLDVLQDATEGSVGKALAQLPDEIDAIFAAGSQGEMRPDEL